MNLDEQNELLYLVKCMEENGWKHQVSGGRVEVFPPKELIRLFGLSEKAKFVSGRTYQEATAFVSGMESILEVLRLSNNLSCLPPTKAFPHRKKRDTS